MSREKLFINNLVNCLKLLVFAMSILNSTILYYVFCHVHHLNVATTAVLLLEHARAHMALNNLP